MPISDYQFKAYVTGGGDQRVQAAMRGFSLAGSNDRMEAMLAGGPLDAPERMPAGSMYCRVGYTFSKAVMPRINLRSA